MNISKKTCKLLMCFNSHHKLRYLAVVLDPRVSHKVYPTCQKVWVVQGHHKLCKWDRFQEVNPEAIHHLLVVCLVSYFRHHLEVEPPPALEVHNQEGIHQCLQIYKTF